jgi:hypothetical protein
MTDTLATVAELLGDEKLLRLEIAKVLTPGPWSHDWSDAQNEATYCSKCHATMTSGSLWGDCLCPDVLRNPLEVLVARLVKKMMGSGHSIFAAAKCAMSIQRGGDVPQETDEWWDHSLYYWLLCTPTDQAACCLLALQRCRIGEKE